MQVPNLLPKTNIRMLVPEALAHTVRGMAIFFFLFWTINIYALRHRSRMMWLCYLLSIFMTVGYVKDLVFLFDEFCYNDYVNRIVTLIDLLCVPMTCTFFSEVTKPGGTSPRSNILLIALQGLFLIAFLVHPSEDIVHWASYTAIAITLYTLTRVVIFALHYQRYVADNYSYTEHISVGWVVMAAIAYVVLHALYFFALTEPTWMGEAVFNGSCMILWYFVFVMSIRHRVIEIQDEEPALPENTEAQAPKQNQEAQEENIRADENDALRQTVWTEELENSLQKVMEVEQIYLNPQLTMLEMANIIGTNRTYLSQYLHDVRKQTFYDYINTYRIEASCRLIKYMAESGERLNMTDISLKSGFNSTSTFYRYFPKIKQMSPGDYYKKLLDAPQNNE